MASRSTQTEDTDKALLLFARGKPGGDVRLATSRWLCGDELHDWASDPAVELYYSTRSQATARPYDTGTVYLGHSHPEGGVPIGWCDDRHILTVAGSRAGKGQSAILPNLYLYRGPVVCIDPKGENASMTADHRADVLGQEVHVLDPYGVANLSKTNLRSAHDPMHSLNANDEEIYEKINLIAESMVVASGEKDVHWDELSRAFISALIGHVLTLPDLGRPRNLVAVRSLFRKGDPERARNYNAQIEFENEVARVEDGAEAVLTPLMSNFDALLLAMSQNEALDGMISGLATRLLDMGYEERGSVLSSTDRHTRFLDGRPMSSVLIKPRGGARKHIDFAKLKTGKVPITIYLCLPTRYLATHARWLRLMINGIMGAVETTGTVDLDAGPRDRILALLDEFPVLGYMRTLEAAIGYMAGYGLRIWAILQDLNQLKRDYPKSWETFLGNTGLQQYFGNTDHTTLEYVSKSLGETEVVREVQTESDLSASDKERLRKGRRSLLDTNGYTKSVQISQQIMKVPLMSPDEIRLTFRREARRQVLLTPDFPPIVAYRRMYFETSEPGQLLDELASRT